MTLYESIVPAQSESPDFTSLTGRDIWRTGLAFTGFIGFGGAVIIAGGLLWTIIGSILFVLGLGCAFYMGIEILLRRRSHRDVSHSKLRIESSENGFCVSLFYNDRSIQECCEEEFVIEIDHPLRGYSLFTRSLYLRRLNQDIVFRVYSRVFGTIDEERRFIDVIEEAGGVCELVQRWHDPWRGFPPLREMAVLNVALYSIIILYLFL